MLAPAMIAVGLATFVVGDRTIYRSQLATRADSPAHRFRFAMPLLAAVPSATPRANPGWSSGLTSRSRRRATAARGGRGAGRARRRRRRRGSWGWRTFAALAGADDQARIESADSLASPILASDDGLDDALGALADDHRSWAPVVADGRLVGVLSVRDAMAAYRSALGRQRSTGTWLPRGWRHPRSRPRTSLDPGRTPRLGGRVASRRRPRGGRAGSPAGRPARRSAAAIRG